jgi:imidazolonepropionase
MMSTKKWDTLWVNATIATCERDAGIVRDAAIAVKDGKIEWIGATAHALPSEAHQVHDVQGRLITPGFIDCHTHLIYAGNRANEFAMRLQGMTYADIARLGGGIQSTVAATRLATEETLLQQSLPRARALMASGATTIEIKSGYGLDIETELKILRVANQIENLLSVTVSKTFLGAHMIPMEYRDQPDLYVDLVCQQMIPRIAKEKLADAVDVFCEHIAFSITQTERVFAAAKQAGLAIKCHAEQLSNSGSAALAARYGAWSVDHLEHADRDSMAAIATSGTVAVLLPGAYYFLRETTMPPIEWLREYNVPIAIASDCNPGTSPIMSLLVILNMACTLFRLTPDEALLGVTQQAAKALGLEKSHGTLTVGKVADLAVWDVTEPSELVYYLGGSPLNQLIKGGRIIH